MRSMWLLSFGLALALAATGCGKEDQPSAPSTSTPPATQKPEVPPGPGSTPVTAPPVEGADQVPAGVWSLKDTEIEYSSHPQGSSINIHSDTKAASSSNTRPDGVAHEYEFEHTWTEPPAVLKPGEEISLTLAVESTRFEGVLGCRGWTSFQPNGESATATISPGNPDATQLKDAKKFDYRVPTGKAGDELVLTIEVSQGRGKGKKHYHYAYN